MREDPCLRQSTLPSESMATGSNSSTCFREEMAWSLTSQGVPATSARAARPSKAQQGPASSHGVTGSYQCTGKPSERVWDSSLNLEIKISGCQVGLNCKLQENQIRIRIRGNFSCLSQVLMVTFPLISLNPRKLVYT